MMFQRAEQTDKRNNKQEDATKYETANYTRGHNARRQSISGHRDQNN
jgi:hypothetical protein